MVRKDNRLLVTIQPIFSNNGIDISVGELVDRLIMNLATTPLLGDLLFLDSKAVGV